MRLYFRSSITYAVKILAVNYFIRYHVTLLWKGLNLCVLPVKLLFMYTFCDGQEKPDGNEEIKGRLFTVL